MGTMSYLSWSSMAATKRAEAREMSCSAERPPKMRASLSMATLYRRMWAGATPKGATLVTWPRAAR